MNTVLNLLDNSKQITIDRHLVLTIPKQGRFIYPPLLDRHNVKYIVLPSLIAGMIPNIVRLATIEGWSNSENHFNILLGTIKKYVYEGSVLKHNQPYNYLPINSFKELGE